MGVDAEHQLRMRLELCARKFREAEDRLKTYERLKNVTAPDVVARLAEVGETFIDCANAPSEVGVRAVEKATELAQKYVVAHCVVTLTEHISALEKELGRYQPVMSRFAPLVYDVDGAIARSKKLADELRKCSRDEWADGVSAILNKSSLPSMEADLKLCLAYFDELEMKGGAIRAAVRSEKWADVSMFLWPIFFLLLGLAISYFFLNPEL